MTERKSCRPYPLLPSRKVFYDQIHNLHAAKIKDHKRVSDISLMTCSVICTCHSKTSASPIDMGLFLSSFNFY